MEIKSDHTDNATSALRISRKGFPRLFGKLRQNNSDKRKLQSNNNKSNSTSDFRYQTFMSQLSDISENDLSVFGSKILSLIAKENEILQAVLFTANHENDTVNLTYKAGYACNNDEIRETSFEPGDGLPGQVYNDRKILNLKDFPEGYIKIKTALGEASPKSLLLIPLVSDDFVVGIIELASFREFSADDESFYHKISFEIADILKPDQP